jgi:hypothetical protein
MRTLLKQTTFLFLLGALGAACTSGSTTAVDAGGNGGGSGADGASSGDSASPGDDGSQGDDGNIADGAMVADSGPPLDGGQWMSPSAVNLGTAGDYVILAKSGISNVPTSAITGDLGLSPAAATYITGFPLTADPTNEFCTTPQVTGKVYASTYAVPTPANLTTAIGDMMTAFTGAAGRAPDVTGLGAGNIGGATLTRGVYEWSTGLLIPVDITLTGSATDVWIFQIAQTLTVANGMHITLSGGALAGNVFWDVGGAVAVGTTAQVEGTFLSQTSIALKTGASIHGRLMAQTAVSIESSTVVHP